MLRQRSCSLDDLPVAHPGACSAAGAGGFRGDAGGARLGYLPEAANSAGWLAGAVRKVWRVVGLALLAGLDARAMLGNAT